MRKIIVFENITVDGLICGPNNEFDWLTRDTEVNKMTKTSDSNVDTFMFGRITYDMMASFWPTKAGEATDADYAHILNNSQKIVFSTTLEKADWQHTTIKRDIDKDEIIKLKQQSGGSMMIFGSSTVVNQLANFDLIDEYQLIVNPVILGRGKHLFKTIEAKANLKLIDSKKFDSGLVFLHYKV